MKFRVLITMLLTALLLVNISGCAAAASPGQPDTVKDTAGDRADTARAQDPVSTSSTAGLLTREQAQAIALEHAGFTADQVTYLRTEYEIDDGIPQYEVQFHQGRWEYDYEINAETGAILSYDRDN